MNTLSSVPKLAAFNMAFKKVFPTKSTLFDCPKVRQLLCLIGAPEDLKDKWWAAPRDADLELTDQQVRICEMLAGPHSHAILKTLQAQADKKAPILAGIQDDH